MKRPSLSYIKKPICIRNAARTVRRAAGMYYAGTDLRRETIEMLLSSVLMQLPMERENGRYL